MKRRPPGWKARQQRKGQARMRGSAPAGWDVQLLQGDDARRAFSALLGRMADNPDAFTWEADFPERGEELTP